MKQAAVFSLLFIMVLGISGCTTLTPSSGAGSGVAIVAFEPDIPTIYSGEPVTFQARIKNTGSFPVSGEVSIDLPGWKNDCNSGIAEKFTKLIPPSPESGTEGEEATFSWTCEAPKIDEGLRMSYQPRLTITYDYKSLTSKTVTLLPTEEVISRNDAGLSLPSETKSASNSPVSVDVQVQGPVRLRRDTDSIEFPVTVKMDNVGNGMIGDGTIEGILVDVDVVGTGGLREVVYDDCHINGLHMWRDKSQTITCEMGAQSIKELRQAWIEVTVSYDYTITGTTNVDVIGQSNAFNR